MEPIITNNLEALATICKRHHVKNLYVFGSATGHGIDGNNFGDESDIDLLVEFDPCVYDFQRFDCSENYFDLCEALEQLFRRKVDLVSIRGIRNQRFRQYVELQKQLIYAA